MSEFAWTSLWEGHYEASISLLWKFAWANAFSAGFVRTRFAEAIRETKHTAKSRGAASNNPYSQWHFPFKRPLNEHRLGHFVGDLYPLVVNHHYYVSEEKRDRTRFCPVCLTQGYLSVFHQIAWLKLCPIHRCEIIDYCLHCHAPSPYYNEIGEGLRRPYHCLSCGYPLAGTFDPESFVSHRYDLVSRERLFEPLEDWFAKLKENIWDVNVPSTRSFPMGLQSHYMRAAHSVLSFLNALEPLRLDHSLLAAAPRQFVKIVGDVQPVREYNPFQSWRDEPVYYALYLALKRHIKRRYLRRHRACLRDVARMESIYRAESLKDYGNRGVCPVALGYHLWRLAFEKVATGPAANVQAPEFRSGARPLELDWRYQESDQFWASRVLVTFFEYVHIVAQTKEWERLERKRQAKARSLSAGTRLSFASRTDLAPPLPKAYSPVFRPKLSKRTESGPFILLLAPDVAEFQEAVRSCPRYAYVGKVEKTLAKNSTTSPSDSFSC